MQPSYRLLSLSLALAALHGHVAAADSAILVDPPDPLGTFGAVIYDERGGAIGVNEIQSRLLSDGHLQLRSEATVQGKSINLMEAELEPVPGTDRLRPVWQHTRTRIGDGEDTLELDVDHRSGLARCRSTGQPAEQVELPDADRVANVALHLMLRPLAAGKVDSLRFQMLVCKGWRRIIDVEAWRTGRRPGEVTEMRFWFDVGPVISTLLQPFLPRIRVWMRPEPPDEWVGSEVPLYPGASNVYLVRSGLDPEPFFDD